MISISEDNGLANIQSQDEHIYSVGISTGGLAEIRMASASPARQIIATTIDQEGARFAQKQIDDAGFSDQITVKLEDAAEPLPYANDSFDFIYARLVLHYLNKQSFMKALHEFYRVLKEGGRLFIVVRSADCRAARDKDSTYDPETGLTTYLFNGRLTQRCFHTEESLEKALTSTGFQIEYIKAYEEYLCADFQRAEPAQYPDALLEVLVTK